MNTRAFLVAVTIVAAMATLALTAIEITTVFDTTSSIPAFAQNITGGQVGNLTTGNLTTGNLTVPVK
ncbi:hypothetical protein BH18THE2_BH18THE2_43840 [soil metagenome]